MSSWGDIFTEQLRGDIFIDQQHYFGQSLTAPGSPEQDLACMTNLPDFSDIPGLTLFGPA